jgi:acyl-CoA synthetase (AMP-forming)/AMP-acid ligase II
VKSTISRAIKDQLTLADIWEQAVDRYGAKPSVMYEGKSLTFREMDSLANKFAHWGTSAGLKKGDVVALYMHNRPEFIAFWVGMAKIGVITALVNYNVRGKPLAHSIAVSGAKLVVTGNEVADGIEEIVATLKQENTRVFNFGEKALPYSTHLNPLTTSCSDKRPPRSARQGMTLSDKALLIYTSGTTGLPKAATITHLRFYLAGLGFTATFEITDKDIIYCCLPLYHSAGGMLGVGMMFASGASLVLRDKFSLTHFWSDCREYKCTVVQYIGELCRYLCQATPRSTDGNNNVRIAIGNGLRPEIWPTFQSRFNIKEIGEFYGSTEGNVSILNHSTTKASQGTLGRTGYLHTKLTGMKLAKFDVLTEEVVRDSAGFCIECQPGESGELLGFIKDDDPIAQFSGYHGNNAATQKKIISDAFKKGDKYFRTGDLLKKDSQGYWYFVDRIGDTFRWKGENVSTNEVAEIASVYPGVSDLNIYGVQVPNHDGRACMAALVKGEGFNLEGFAKHCISNLPAYSVPVFVRYLPAMDLTGTFKLQKVQLRQEGCDPSKISDPLFVLDKAAGGYVPLTKEAYKAIETSTKSKL